MRQLLLQGERNERVSWNIMPSFCHHLRFYGAEMTPYRQMTGS